MLMEDSQLQEGRSLWGLQLGTIYKKDKNGLKRDANREKKFVMVKFLYLSNRYELTTKTAYIVLQITLLN